MAEQSAGTPTDPSRGKRIAGALSYLLGPLVLLVPSLGPRVRFHAFQATLLALVVGIVNLAVWIIVASIFRYSWHAGTGALTYVSYLYMAEAVLWMVMLYFGYELAVIEIPTIGRVAKRLAGEA